MTIVVAMALMSIAIALSYSVLRTQSMSVQIQANSNLRERARQAAWSGFAAGLRAMHQSSWGGVNSSIGGYVNATDRFSVSYATGDPTLTAQSANYRDYPYRVTLSVAGSAVDPAHHERHTRELRGRQRSFFVLPYEDRYIWGATAGILRALYERLYGASLA